MSRRDDARGISEGLSVLISGIVGIVVAVAAVWYVSGPLDSPTETLYRVNPTAESPAIGTDFVAGNTDPLFDALIAVVHAADVVMGLFILVMVFVHWGAFRRLAARMQEPGEATEGVADGGRVERDAPDAGTDGGTDGENGGETA